MNSYSRHTGMLAIIIIGLVIFSSVVFARQPSDHEIKQHCAQVINYLGLGLLRSKASGDSSLQQMLKIAEEVFAEYPPYFLDAVKSYTTAVWSGQNEQYHTDKMFKACVRYNKENLPKEYW